MPHGGFCSLSLHLSASLRVLNRNVHLLKNLPKIQQRQEENEEIDGTREDIVDIGK